MNVPVNPRFICITSSIALAFLACTTYCQAEDIPLPVTLSIDTSSVAAPNTAPPSKTAPETMPSSPLLIGADSDEQDIDAHAGKNRAMASAVADGVTTGLALSAGGIETNPLISTSPAGLIALTGMKLGLVKYADTLPKDEKRLTMKSTSAVWGGAAVNNIMVLFAAPPPFPILAGLIMGIATWNHMQNQYEKEDLLIMTDINRHVKEKPRLPAPLMQENALEN